MNVWECICVVVGIIIVGLCICMGMMLFAKPQEMEDELPKTAVDDRKKKIKEEADKKKAKREEEKKNKKVAHVFSIIDEDEAKKYEQISFDEVWPEIPKTKKSKKK